MIAVILLLGTWWAVSGAVAHVKRALASEPATVQSTASASAGSTPPHAKRGRRINSDDVTFGQWQQAMYRRWKTNIRRHLPGQRLGRRAVDLVGDITAATLAGGAIFGMGFISGTTWMGSRWAVHHARTRTRSTPRSARPQPETDNNRPPLDENFTTPDGFNLGFEDTVHRDGWQPRPGWPFNSASYSGFNDEPIDAELTDDIGAPAAPAANSRFAGDEYADIVGQPELLAHYPEPRSGDNVSEILTIHHLFDLSKAVIAQATGTAEQDTIRANSASERAEQASNRSLTAGNRAEQAGIIAGDATSQATKLEEAAARFSGLNMDSASLASMTTVIEAANTHAADKRRRAEAEANVAAIAATLAQAEDVAAAAAAASATSAMNLVEAAKGMHDTVQAHQMPHAEAQAATGNAAAHASVLAAS